MPPCTANHDVTPDLEEPFQKLTAPQAGPRVYTVTWTRVFGYIYYHLAAIYGLYTLITASSWATVAFTCGAYYISSMGLTAGVHRLWSHKAYKATMPLQIFLMLCHSMAMQHTIFLWVKDHRLHHKYAETDADPYNATRGFIYSHVGWTCVDRHPEVKRRGQLLDLSDMFSNPVVMFQKRNIVWLNLTLGFIIPTLIPMYFWQETFSIAYHANIFRYVLSLNSIFMVNSFAHMFGTKPYDKGIQPTQNLLVTLISLGEGFHNYHHVFPYDYRTGELGSFLNFSTSFIDFCAWLGLAYDRRSVSRDVLEKRMARTGDGSVDKYGMFFG